MFAYVVLFCVFSLLLYAITLAALAYVLRDVTTQILERTLHRRERPDTGGW